MKTRPIIFNGEMVQAILGGHKTQTRRVIKDLGAYELGPIDVLHGLSTWDGKYGLGFEYQTEVDDTGFMSIPCPYGKPGDRLWVRETFWIEHDSDSTDGASWDCGIDLKEDSWASVWYCATSKGPDEFVRYYSKRPSIHMPRWASRITLEVKAMRVERVQEITIEDVMDEGIEAIDYDGGGNKFVDAEFSFLEFQQLWDSINAKRGFSWESNPWVWVVEFEVIK